MKNQRVLEGQRESDGADMDGGESDRKKEYQIEMKK